MSVVGLRLRLSNGELAGRTPKCQRCPAGSAVTFGGRSAGSTPRANAQGGIGRPPSGSGPRASSDAPFPAGAPSQACPASTPSGFPPCVLPDCLSAKLPWIADILPCLTHLILHILCDDVTVALQGYSSAVMLGIRLASL